MDFFTGLLLEVQMHRITLNLAALLMSASTAAQGVFTICDSLVAPNRVCSQVSVTELGHRPLATQVISKPGPLLTTLAERQAELALVASAPAQMCGAFTPVSLTHNGAQLQISETQGPQDFARIDLRDVTVNGVTFASVPIWVLRNRANGHRFLQLRPQFEATLAGVPGLGDTSLSLDANGTLYSDELSNSTGVGRVLIEAVLAQGGTLIAGATVAAQAPKTFPSVWSVDDIAALLDAFRKEFTVVSFPSPIAKLVCSTDPAPYQQCENSGLLNDANAAISALASKYVATGTDALLAELLRGYKSWAQANALLNWATYNPADPNQTDLRYKYIPNNSITPTILNVWSIVRDDRRVGPTDRQFVDKWVQALGRKAFEPYRYSNDWGNNNQGLLQASIAMSVAVMFQDDTLWRKSLTFFAHALHVMRPDGSLPYEIERGACGLQYQNTAISSLVYMAAMADRQGFDLFTVEYEGRSLSKSIGFLLDAVQNTALADHYRVAGAACNYPDSDSQHLELFTMGRRASGQMVSYSAWVDTFLHRFPNHPRRSDLLALFGGGVPAARPLNHTLSGGPSSCLTGSTFSPDAELLFDKAEQLFAQYFNPAGQRSRAGSGFQYRFYPGTGNYVGVLGENVYTLTSSPGATPALVGPLGMLLDTFR